MITAFASLDTAITATSGGLRLPGQAVHAGGSEGGGAQGGQTPDPSTSGSPPGRGETTGPFSVHFGAGARAQGTVGAIEGYLHILKDRTLSQDPAVYRQAVDRSLVRIQGMRKLILDLLDLTRIESGNRKRDLRDLDVCEVAKGSIETVMPDATAKQISIELQAVEPVRMAADRGELEIVLNNLLSNAVKYNREGGKVSVALGVLGPRVRIAVSDTGIGMAPEEARQLFQEFFRSRTHRLAHSGERTRGSPS